MRRILSTYFQSYSPFVGFHLLGDIPPLDKEPVPDLRERLCIAIGVQTEDLPPSPSPPGTPVMVAIQDVPSVTSDPQDLQEDSTAFVPSPLSTPRAPTPGLPPVLTDPIHAPVDQEDAPQNDTPSSTAPTVVPDPAEPLTPQDDDKAIDVPELPTPGPAPAETVPVEDWSPQRDEELWFDDGNLSIVAGNVEFRVYKGPLMKQSGFFKDMLSLPQPSLPASVSCATVQVSDSPEDMRHFLRTFVEGGLRFEPTFHEISAYIRLGHKYQCDKLVQRSVDYLKKYYVDNFDEWFKVTSLDPPTFQSIHRIGVVNLARLAGADGLLPVALMCCCMLGSDISKGFTREDGTLETLSVEDLTRCFVGRAKLLEATFVATHRTFRDTVAPDCKNPSRCKEALQRLLHQMIENADLMRDIRDLRFDNSKTDYINSTDDDRELCSRCFTMIGKTGRQQEQHKEIFKKLPEIMDVQVEGWWTGVDNNVQVEDPDT
ncbi:hypothetical protein L226DRAFT_611302 [Lentinus tigrinus ALCF2SS1-7]|uniref:uncharacterized protein n=1 Tax=Lentinus tigrinus ALCF2SS1-7 TaxID=1328758 RepID=UPI0011664029|nr:hypothetical protein L226DRAFT_611302 [Lentinus tigrinus ALCF2SS1-7]